MNLKPAQRQELLSENKTQMQKYLRNRESIPIKKIKDKKLKSKLKSTNLKAEDAALAASQAEVLLVQEAGFLEGEGMERTWKFSQKELAKHVDLATQAKMFELNLPDFGPYNVDYTRNGRHLLIGGRKGHVAAFDWQTGNLACELQLRETVKDVTWLHNDTMFAVAQKKYTYIYDKTGLELHCLRDHIEANRLDFLPYHFLLVSVGNAGYLKYQDTSTGQLVVELRTKLGKCDTMTQNPFNAIMHLGHANGTVSLWSPNMPDPLVKMFCHKGPVQSIAIDNAGRYMATAGLDGQLRLWDVRTYKEIDSYFTTKPAATLSFSATGLLAVGSGPRVTVWKDIFKSKQKEPYMSHLFAGSSVRDVEFCPFEDILGCGYTNGFSNLVIPGSGEANFDSMEANPYQTVKQRQESEIHSLLNKIQPDMISLNPNFVGNMDRTPDEILKEEARLEWEVRFINQANNPKEKFKPRKRARGKSSSQRRYLRKQGNVLDEKRIELKERLETEKKTREIERQKEKGIYVEPKKSALDRFKI